MLSRDLSPMFLQLIQNTLRKGISLIPNISPTAVFGRKVLVTKYSFRYLSHYDFRNIHTAYIMVSAITDM